MKEYFKSQKGITVISLVITIIVMIIIASISIKMGLSSINSTQDSSIETNLEIVQQAITQQYSKAMTLDNLDIESNINGIAGEDDEDAQKPNAFIGTPLTQDELKNFLEKHPNAPDLINIDKLYNYDTTDFEDIYYLISDNELKELGIDVGKGQEYIINYSTGEVLDITNESFSSGEPAYINGFTSMLEIDEEAFVDTPINITIHEELTKTADGYKFSIKVTDEIAKITPEGTNSEGNKLTSTNDPDDLNENDIITENIVIKGNDPDNPATEGVTITKKIKPDPSQGIGEHYIYEIEIKDETGIIDPTNPSITIEIKPESVIDDEGNGNATTELTTSDDSIDVENVQFDFTLGNVKYYAKDLNGELIDGITIGDEQWGSSASVDLTIKTDDIKGLNKNTYIFEYIWSLDENINWEDAKTVSITPKQGASEVKSTLYLEGYTGKGYLHVKPSAELLTASGKKMENTEKTISVNLDCTPPEIRVFYEDENGNQKDINEFLSQDNAFIRFYLKATPPAYGHTAPNITYKFIDNETGIYTDEDSSLFSAHLFYQKNQNPKEIKNFARHPDDQPYTQWYCTDHTKQNESGFGSEDGFLKWYQNFHILYTSNLASGEYYIAFATHPTLIEKEIYLIDNCGNKLKDIYTIGPIKVDSIAPEIKSIEIADDGNTVIRVKDDYSGLEIDYSKIKYAWIKESTIPDDVEWKSVTEEQIKQQIKNASTKNIAELKIDIGTPDDTEECYLAVKLDDLKDIAGNTVNTTLVSEETAKKDVFEFRLENLQYTSTNESGEVQDGVTIGNDTWGTSATVDLVLSSTGKKGLKAGNYQFEYIWTTEENYNWDTNGIKTAVLVANNGLDSTTFNIKIDSYTGKGYLHVRPKQEYKSAAGVKLDTTPKNVIMNLDNIAPEFFVKYKNENGVYEDFENIATNQDFYLRKGALQQTTSSIDGYFDPIPELKIGFEDFDSGTNTSAHMLYDLAERDEIDEHMSLYGTTNIIDSCSPQSYYGVGTIIKDENGYPIVIERDIEFLKSTLDNSGEYYLILFDSFHLARSLNVVDNVGNKILEPKIVGPIKVDSIAPKITDISMNEEGNVQIYLNDDYSGLTTDYSKIKYAWVKNKSTVPTNWSNSVSSDQIEIDTYNEYNNPTDIIATIGIPPEEGNWYLAIKMEGYEDIAGNQVDDTITYSDESFEFAKDLVIEISEEDGIVYPQYVKYTIKSESNSNFKINNVWYEHKGLDDKIEILNTEVYCVESLEGLIETRVNGPIIVHVVDGFGNEYSEEYTIKNVQESKLVYNITDTSLPLMLPIVERGSGRVTFLAYVDWGDGTKEYIDLVSFSTSAECSYENNNNVAFHNYSTTGNVEVKISGDLHSKWNYQGGFGTSELEWLKTSTDSTATRLRTLMEYSRNALVAINQFGMHKTTRYNTLENYLMECYYWNCKNLVELPVCNEVNQYAFSNIIGLNSTFKGTGITHFDSEFFANASNLSYLTDTFKDCKSLTQIELNLLDNTDIHSFVGVFQNSGLQSIPMDENGESIFRNTPIITSFNFAFANTRITEIPEKIFKGQEALVNMDSTFSGTKITEIPNNLFDNVNVDSLSSTFANCTNITEVSSSIWGNMNSAYRINYLFNGCTNLNTISDNLFEGFEELIQASGCFRNCYSLQKIDKAIFKDCKNLERIGAMFFGCYNLSYVREDLFEDSKNNIERITLKGIATDENREYYEYKGIFEGCSILTTCPKFWEWTQFSADKINEDSWDAYNGVNDTSIINNITQSGLQSYWLQDHETERN